MKRRTFLDLATLGPLGAALARPARAADAGAKNGLDLARLKAAPGWVTGVDGGRLGEVTLERSWEGGSCRARISNAGKRPAAIKEIVLFSLAHELPATTALYGESLQMLSQTGGTLGAPEHLGYDERKHYKVPEPEGVVQAVSGLLLLTPPGGVTALFGFASCKRFVGRFYLRQGIVEGIFDGEGLTLAPGQSWDLEEFFFATGPTQAPLLATLAGHINRNHPPLPWPKPPTGWCSWYCFGPRVTAEDVTQNLDVIAKDVPELKYVQIDDGYQPMMGDWLETGKAFGGDVKGVLAAIRKRGFEPAIWVAPFIAEAGSRIFRKHPKWFVKGADGKPLPSDRVTFGGWRRGPWYVLDGTHPEVQAHFQRFFTIMRKDWGCTYFKLDANFWGAIHGGRFHDPKATRIEAYRRGMTAILRGTGSAFVLGCNHPIWGSFGLIHGSRSSGDVKRTWDRFKKIARQNLSRNWQNGTLWWNDSDAICLTGDLSEDEFRFHATAVYASGGLILSGDDLTKIPPPRLAMLKKLLPPTGRAAVFDDPSLRIGRVTTPEGEMLCLFNPDDAPKDLSVKLSARSEVADFWTGADLGRHEGILALGPMAPHSARLLVCRRSRS
jgi:alpha-galactosidase